MIDQLSYVFQESTEAGHSPIYRSHFNKDSGNLITVPKTGSKTVYETFQYSIKNYSQRLCYGSRRIIDTIVEKKEVEKKVNGETIKEIKEWQYSQLSPYEWMTYEQVGKEVNNVGSALKFLGLGNDKKVALFAPTSRYWSALANACYTQNTTVVTIYDTLGVDGLKHGINQCQVPVLFIAESQIKVLKQALPETPSLTTIFSSEPLSDAAKSSLLSINSELAFYSFEDLISLGQSNPVEHNPPQPEDVALIMYTSGTTGNPKGVVIPHQQLTAIIAGVDTLLDGVLFAETDVFISFLPFAHILAFAVDCYLIYIGTRIGYASPRTLTDASVRNCKGDLRELQPTIIIGVPTIYDSIRKGILNKVNAAGTVSSTIFQTALSLKSNLSYYGIPTSLLDSLVFSKVKEMTGGKLRLAVTGGAPISDEVRDFFTNAVCLLIQGYGLTEVCGLACVTTPDIVRPNCLGQMSPCNEFKLVDVPEAGYFHTSNPPQGELWIRGGSVTKGYYLNEEATKEAFTEDGWFQTGDIVTMYDNGSLSMIDRKKNLVKLSNGEYIALEMLEKAYKNSLFVQNLCVCADSLKSRPVALVQPNLDAVNNYLKANQMPELYNLEEVATNVDVKKVILNDLLKEAKTNSFTTSQTIVDIAITNIEFTPENGLLTTSQKLKRKPISDRFKDELKVMYEKI